MIKKLLALLEENIDLKKWSVIGRENEREILTRFLVENKINTLLEIGTFKGVATAYISQFVNKIITIDIAEQPGKYKLWEELDIKNIEHYTVKTENEKAKIIKNLEFDFAFVDGMHRAPFPEKDFNYTAKCGRVLFHDYRPGEIMFAGVFDIVNKIIYTTKILPYGKCEIDLPFAYWNREN
jgi:protein-L-isoaspartate O-methyltransferase